MKEEQSKKIQNIAGICLCLGLIVAVVLNYFRNDSTADKIAGEIGKTSVSVFDRMRTEENVTLPPDPLVNSVNKAASLPSPTEKKLDLMTLPEGAILPQTGVALPSESLKKGYVPEIDPSLAVQPHAAPVTACSDEDWRLGKCDLPSPSILKESEDVRFVSTEHHRDAEHRPGASESKSRGTVPSIEESYASGPSGRSGGEDLWGEIASDKAKSLKGARPDYVGPVIKSQCRVMAQIVDAVRVGDTSKPQKLTLNVKGPMPGCELPAIKGGLILGADAVLSENRKGVRADVTICSDSSPSNPSHACKGVVKSITGEDILEGEIYDQSWFGDILDFGVNVLGFLAIRDLVGNASKVENPWSASATLGIADKFQEAIQEQGKKIKQRFDGREIKMARGAPVIVVFTQDVIL